MTDRRAFIKVTGGMMGAFAMSGCKGLMTGTKSQFQLGMAGWTLNHLKVDEALVFCEKHGFHGLCVKDFHLPYDSKSAQIAEFLRKCTDHGVRPYGAGPIEFSTLDEAKRSFDFVADLGVPTMVGVPWQPDAQGRKTWGHTCSNLALCEKIAELANSYKINFGIHNHGANPKTGVPSLWPTPEAIMRTLEPLGPRMGLCLDIAYTHADGFDVPTVIRRYGSRIFDGHVRCISDATNGSSGCAPAQRAFDYAAIFDAFREVGYSGVLGLELAKASKDGLTWAEWERRIDESRDYFTGLI